jgi:hypothetical protein
VALRSPFDMTSAVAGPVPPRSHVQVLTNTSVSNSVCLARHDACVSQNITRAQLRDDLVWRSWHVTCIVVH